MLSKSTEYAIRSLVFIQIRNWEEKRPGIIEIAQEIEAPKPFAAKVLQILTRHGLVHSLKGRGGGFYFSEKHLNIKIYDIIHIMEGDGIFHKCGFGLKDCSNLNPCPLHDRYAEVRDGFFQIVNTETIYSLAKKVVEGTAVLNSMTNLN